MYRFIILQLMALVGACWSIQAQTHRLTFEYDAAGNQVSRIYTTTAAKELLPNAAAKESDLEDIEHLNKVLAEAIKIYPNPTEGMLKVSFDSAIEDRLKAIKVTDFLGHQWEVSTAKLSNSSIEIDLMQQASGTYIIQFDFTGLESYTTKVIKH